MRTFGRRPTTALHLDMASTHAQERLLDAAFEDFATSLVVSNINYLDELAGRSAISRSWALVAENNFARAPVNLKVRLSCRFILTRYATAS
jgi:hypothetical protein